MMKVTYLVTDIEFDENEIEEKEIDVEELPTSFVAYGLMGSMVTDEMVAEQLSKQMKDEFGCTPIYFVRTVIPM